MLDGLTLMAVTAQLQNALGERVERVLQPETDEIHLSLKNSKRILISASPMNCRVQLTAIKKANPKTAPMFCMLLRKWLTGAVITSITQINCDRIVEIAFERKNEFMEISRLTLVAEIMGRHSNIMLLDDNRVIMDAIKRVGVSMSTTRVILPGTPYSPPPTALKLNPFFASSDDFCRVLNEAGNIGKLLSANFYGLAPDMALALSESLIPLNTERTENISDNDKKTLSHALEAFYCNAKRGFFSPHITVDNNAHLLKLYPFAPNMPQENLRAVESVSDALDELYEKRDTNESMRRLSNGLITTLKQIIARRERKLAIYGDAISSDDELDKLRMEGEAIISNLYRLNRGESFFRATVYDDNGAHDIEIELDIKLTPSENAEHRFRQYRRAKAARENAIKLTDEVKAELEYLHDALDSAQRAMTPEDIREIREQVSDAGYIKRASVDKKRKAAKKPQESEPLRFTTSDGHYVYIGKNSRQNEHVTFRIGAPEDIWLHVRAMPGSHCILKLKDSETNPSPQAIAEAAQLAAYYSSARMSENVPVDYTRRKRVKKHPSGNPGLVNYTDQRTLFVDPVDNIR